MKITRHASQVRQGELASLHHFITGSRIYGSLASTKLTHSIRQKVWAISGCSMRQEPSASPTTSWMHTRLWKRSCQPRLFLATDKVLPF